MKPTKALKHYKTRAAMAKAAGVSRQAVSVWFQRGVVPIAKAIALAEASGGKLTVDFKLYA